METIHVKIHPALDENRVAIVDASQEQMKLWKGGLSIVKTDKNAQETYEVVETLEVLQALKSNRLMKTDAKKVEKVTK